MIFAGLWFGSSKPVMLTFLQPFHSALSNLENEGLLVETFDNNHFTTCAILLAGTCDLPAGTCDLPAKCLVCNTIQYNGFYWLFEMQTGWTDCENGKKGGHACYALEFANPKGPKRTHNETLVESRQAASQRKSVNVIKGPS